MLREPNETTAIVNDTVSDCEYKGGQGESFQGFLLFLF